MINGIPDLIISVLPSVAARLGAGVPGDLHQGDCCEGMVDGGDGGTRQDQGQEGCQVMADARAGGGLLS